MDVLTRVPVREQEPAVRAATLKKYVWDIMKKKQWQKLPAA